MRNALGTVGIVLGVIAWLVGSFLLYATATGQIIAAVIGILLMIGIPIWACIDTIWD